MDDSLNLRVLLVEDDATVAMLIEDMLEALGCQVARSIADISHTDGVADDVEFDLAILDINVAGRPVFPFAQDLKQRGKPVLFSTGYGQAGLPAEFHSCPVLAKPYSMDDLQRTLRDVMEARPGGS